MIQQQQRVAHLSVFKYFLRVFVAVLLCLGVCTEGVAQNPPCTCTDCRCADSLELVKLYNSTDGANWTNKWTLTEPMSGWYGVSLDASGRVIKVVLDNNQLNGTIPNFNLPNLT